ncbi:TraR/DksA C4-type zinc finger protein [Kribbella sp. NPDC049227]|uniref:TraR/DksA C4-type zinc finger protein n=1 Tax=Kribbella sp. NPDC049227 TaxID=3364113 RepID=UPI00371D30C8
MRGRTFSDRRGPLPQRDRARGTPAEDRLTGDTYGTCQSCKTRIPIERLEILPYVRHALERM